MLEQQTDVEWPTGIFTNMWNAILADELTDDAIAEIKMGDDLRKLKLPRDMDPKELVEEMASIEVKYTCITTKRKKAAVVLRAGSKDYSVIMAMISSMGQATSQRSATAAEYVAGMHMQFRIAGHIKTGKKRKDETDDYDEVTLAEVGEFNGNCNHCDKKGHKEIDCWSKCAEKRPSGNGRIKCNFCNKMYYKESD